MKNKTRKKPTKADAKFSYSTLKMEMILSPKTPEFLRTTRHYSPEEEFTP
jgi:hypothetical protein